MKVHLRKSDDRSSGGLLDRLLAAPQVAQIVPRLQPEVIHRVIKHCGLEDCAQLLAFATPDQVAYLFDLDLWRPPAPGLDDQFDADRFGTWLDVMVEAGGSNAATTLAAIDVELVAAGLMQHVRVFDSAAVAPYVTLDGDEASSRIALDDGLRCEIGGYVVAAKRREFWDAITAVLSALAEAHGTYFAQVMLACCRLSNSRPEIDGLDDLLSINEQAMFDVAVDREGRRDTQGYVTPAQARAFLQTSRQIDVRHGGVPPRDQVTRAYFRAVEAQLAIERDTRLPELASRDRGAPLADATDAVAAVVELLHEAGVMPRVPRALLAGPQTGAPRLARVRAHLQFAHDRDPGAYAMRNAELAYLANAIAAGSCLQSRPVTAEESSKAAVAVCNLGLEHWPVHWLPGEGRRGLSVAEAGLELPEDFLIRQDLVSVFQVGWTLLYEDVCMYAADTLVGILASVHYGDADAQASLESLRITLMKHWRAGSPWDARDALDVIALIDTPSWAALLGLIDQLPTMHAAVDALLEGTTRQIDATAFEFISENSHIQQVRHFMRLLPGILRG